MQSRYFAAPLATLGLIVASAAVSFAQTPNKLVATSPPATENRSTVTTNNIVANSSTENAGPKIDPDAVKTMSDDEVNSLYDQMSAGYSKDAVLFNNIGATFYDRKMYDKAIGALQRAIVLRNHPAFLTNLSIVYDTLGRTAEAISLAQRAIFQSPRYVRARTQLCELMMVTKRNADTLICYDELKQIAPLDVLSQTYYAIALMRSGGADKAIAMLTPLSQGTQAPALTFNVLGNAYFQRKKYAQAAESFKQGVERDPDNTELRYNLAIALTAGNNRDGALSQYKLMKQKNPAMADKLYRLLYRDSMIFVDETTAKKP